MRFYGNGIVWDGPRNCPLMAFVDGVYDTDDERIQDVLIRGGYEYDPVDEPESPTLEPEPEPAQDEPASALTDKPIYRMNTAELEQYAREKGIDISDCKNNRDRMGRLK